MTILIYTAAFVGGAIGMAVLAAVVIRVFVWVLD